MAATSRPLDSPLPPVPQRLEPKPEPKPPKAIVRRPVAAPAPVASPPTAAPPPPASASAPVLAPPVLAPVPVHVPAPVPSPLSARGLALSPAPVSPIGLSPSPVGSFSSLLSAYSNHTSSSTPRTSTNSANDITSAKGSYSAVSPGDQIRGGGVNSADGPGLALSLSGRNAWEQNAHEQRTRAREEQELPPPPPLKDVNRSPTPPVALKLQTQPVHSPADTHSPSPLTNTSPKQDQLWRRRSLKSEKNLAVPQLKLVSSNGSTAAPNQNPSTNGTTQATAGPQPLHSATTTTRTDLPAAAAVTRLPAPKGAGAAFPGRNIRPVPSRQQVVSTTEHEDMGQKASHVARDLAPRGRSNEEVQAAGFLRKSPRPTQASTVSPTKPLPSMPSPNPIVRLPTPEYELSDVKNAIVETIVSPVSPASSPDLPTEPKSAGIPKPATETENPIRHAKSSPALAARPTFAGAAGRLPLGLPGSPAATRDRALDQPGQSPVVSRREPTGPSPLAFAKQRDPVPQARPNEQRTVSENGSTASDETLKPSMPSFGAATYQQIQVPPAPPSEGTVTEEPETTDHPGAALFPRNWYKPLPADTVMDARPLESKHFRCLTQHRYMTTARQRVNPIACRTCGSRDRHADAHICSACSLNICTRCNAKLRRVRGDLERLLVQLQEKAATEGEEGPQVARETARPDSETFAVPSGQPPLAFVIEAE
ncbi:hypothetical protein B0T18DRAFT_434154 [Schizothecium vesticola]|uniref:FYVE-type domain-containing protein n=1 Tax=Schizothecium vesticola TaxID=314040 RepID=A0AA40KBQ6_9PEZI|nr:hypothetical protein B0T18DRAFT_434154 [Schizothecium vesticola]